MGSCWCPARCSSGEGLSSRCTRGSWAWPRTTRSWRLRRGVFAGRRLPSRRGRRSCSESRSRGWRSKLCVPDVRVSTSPGRHARGRVRSSGVRLRGVASELARRLGRSRCDRSRAQARSGSGRRVFRGRSVILRGEDLIRLVWTVVGTAAVACSGFSMTSSFPSRGGATPPWSTISTASRLRLPAPAACRRNFVFNNGGDAGFLPPTRVDLPRSSRAPTRSSWRYSSPPHSCVAYAS